MSVTMIREKLNSVPPAGPGLTVIFNTEGMRATTRPDDTP